MERKVRPSTRPAPNDVVGDDIPTKVMPATLKRAAEAEATASQRSPAQARRIQQRTAQRVVGGSSAREVPAGTARPTGNTKQEPIVLKQRRSAKPEQRWLLLLKVGKEQLARVWDQGLASCEPIVWRPTTKAWAPLFDVPQIAAFVTSIPPQKASGAPARVPDTVRSPPPSGMDSASSMPGSLVAPHSGGVPPHAVLRSPYIPRPPRVPRDTVKGPFGSLGEPVNPFTAAGQGARVTVRPPAPAASPTPALRLDHDTARRRANTEPRIAVDVQPPVTQRARAEAPALRETVRRAAPDSFAPQVRSLSGASERTSGALIERAAWLMVGVVLALVLTLFPEVTNHLRRQLASWIAPDVDTIVAGSSASASASSALHQAEARRAATRPTPSAKNTESKPEPAAKEDAAVAVEDLFADHAKGAKEASDDAAAGPHADEPAGATSKSKATSTGKAALKSGVPQRSANRAHGKSAATSSGFDTGAARRALASAVQRAQFCAAERAYGTITVTFAPSGGVQGVGLASLRGEEVRRGCVIRAFRGARVSPFSGSAVTVQKSFRLR